MNELLTDVERQALDKLIDVWNLYLQLPVEHPMHQQEFAFYIHGAQRIIFARGINRRMDFLAGNAEEVQP